jgi:hypothetical protein
VEALRTIQADAKWSVLVIRADRDARYEARHRRHQPGREGRPERRLISFITFYLDVVRELLYIPRAI